MHSEVGLLRWWAHGAFEALGIFINCRHWVLKRPRHNVLLPWRQLTSLGEVQWLHNTGDLLIDGNRSSEQGRFIQTGCWLCVRNYRSACDNRWVLLAEAAVSLLKEWWRQVGDLLLFIPIIYRSLLYSKVEGRLLSLFNLLWRNGSRLWSFSNFCGNLFSIPRFRCSFSGIIVHPPVENLLRLLFVGVWLEIRFKPTILQTIGALAQVRYFRTPNRQCIVSGYVGAGSNDLICEGSVRSSRDQWAIWILTRLWYEWGTALGLHCLLPQMNIEFWDYWFLKVFLFYLWLLNHDMSLFVFEWVFE